MKFLPEQNIHYICSVALSPLSQGIHFPESTHILLQNLHQFPKLFQRHFVLVYVAESMIGLSSNAFNTQGVLCIWPWPITLRTLWSNVTEGDIGVDCLPSTKSKHI